MARTTLAGMAVLLCVLCMAIGLVSAAVYGASRVAPIEQIPQVSAQIVGAPARELQPGHLWNASVSTNMTWKQEASWPSVLPPEELTAAKESKQVTNRGTAANHTSEGSSLGQKGFDVERVESLLRHAARLEQRAKWEVGIHALVP